MLAADGAKGGVFVALVQLDVARGFGGGPAENEGDVVDEGCFGELFEGCFVVGDVDHGEEDAQVVFSLEIADASVDVLGVKTMVLETI